MSTSVLQHRSRKREALYRERPHTTWPPWDPGLKVSEGGAWEETHRGRSLRALFPVRLHSQNPSPVSRVSVWQGNLLPVGGVLTAVWCLPVNTDAFFFSFVYTEDTRSCEMQQKSDRVINYEMVLK